MKRKLNIREMAAVASMLFGMFFGAGNLIFPVHMGQLAGSNVWGALLGFIITGVGLPLLGVAALGSSRSNGLQAMSSRVGKGYGVFFTCALYLTIGPCFAVPRCGTTSFTVGIAPLLGEMSPEMESLALSAFTLLFFGLAMFFTLRPNGILTWIGKIINPVFLGFLGLLIVIALVNPIAAVGSIQPDAAYSSGAFFNGFLEGYNTMDALASLAFGIVVIDVIRDIGITDGDALASNTIKSGFFSCLLMALIYLGVSVVGTQSRGLFPISANGGIALADISNHYFGTLGNVFLAITVTLACLKTTIGLLTSTAETFSKMFPKSPGYTFWAVVFGVVALLVANLGLNSIITYAVPVLMFLYPLAITLILLALFGKLFQHDRVVYISVTAFTLVAALFDLINALAGTLPEHITAALHLTAVTDVAAKILPLFTLGLGWIVPSLIGLAVGLVLHGFRRSKEKKA